MDPFFLDQHPDRVLKDLEAFPSVWALWGVGPSDGQNGQQHQKSSDGRYCTMVGGELVKDMNIHTHTRIYIYIYTYTSTMLSTK